MATCCLNGTLYPCHVGSSHSWWAQRMGRMYASISGIISGCFFPTTAMHMVKHMVQVHTSSTALRLALTTSRPGRITWCWGCGSGSSTPCMPMACSTHSSTWICSTSLFASGGNPLPTDTYVSLEQVSSPLFGHTLECTRGQQHAYHLESDLSLPPSSLHFPLQLQHSLELENVSSHKYHNNLIFY